MPIAALEDLVNIHSVVRNIISLQAASSGEGVQRTIYTGIFNLYDGVTVLCEASGIVPPEDCDKFRSKISEYVFFNAPFSKLTSQDNSLHRASESIEEDSENHCRGIMRIAKNPLKSFRTWREAVRFELDSLAILADIKVRAPFDSANEVTNVLSFRKPQSNVI